MDVERLIHCLKCCSLEDKVSGCDQCYLEYCSDACQHLCEDAATVITNLQIELKKVNTEKNATIEQLHGICSACNNYSENHNTGKCRFCVYESVRDVDAEVNDNWEWCGKKG